VKAGLFRDVFFSTTGVVRDAYGTGKFAKDTKSTAGRDAGSTMMPSLIWRGGILDVLKKPNLGRYNVHVR
jgi:hypothetical protein